MPAAAGRAGVGTVVYVVVGSAGWMGATVYVAANNSDPSDATPILRTFAVGGGVFFGLIFGAAALGARRRSTRFDDDLYRRLAIDPVPEPSMRRQVRRTDLIRYVYILFGATSTGLVLTAIGLGEEGPFAPLMYTAGILVVVWTVVGLWTFGRLLKGAARLLGPLGLRSSSTPVPGPRGRLHGAVGYKGTRRGRAVAITQLTTGAVTAIDGSFEAMILTEPQQIAAVVGEDPRLWRHVHAQSGPDGITVERRGNGAGRFILYDLLLAEGLADR